MRSLHRSGLLVVSCTFAFAPLAPAEEAHSMRGCLAKGADERSFVLTHVEGPVSTVVIAQATPDLSKHIGHKVEITGVTIAGADPKTHTMQVSAMKHIAASCP